jgi:hypothetical protein
VRLANPERYVGTYVMMGTSYEVTLDGGSLLMTIRRQVDFTTKMPEHPYWGEPTSTVRLVPIAEDGFLMESLEGALGGEMGFSGDDGGGRATVLVAPYFPAKRAR